MCENLYLSIFMMIYSIYEIIKLENNTSNENNFFSNEHFFSLTFPKTFYIENSNKNCFLFSLLAVQFKVEHIPKRISTLNIMFIQSHMHGECFYFFFISAHLLLRKKTIFSCRIIGTTIKCTKRKCYRIFVSQFCLVVVVILKVIFGKMFIYSSTTKWSHVLKTFVYICFEIMGMLPKIVFQNIWAKFW